MTATLFKQSKLDVILQEIINLICWSHYYYFKTRYILIYLVNFIICWYLSLSHYYDAKAR